MKLDLEALGFTKEELQQRVIDQICDQLLNTTGSDEDGEEVRYSSTIHRKLTEAITKRIDEAVNAIADKHVLPNVHTYLEQLVLEKTNQWGEKKGEKLTFIEYIVQRADSYMREEVNYQGKTREQEGYNWTKQGTRVAHMIHEHLSFRISSAMKTALDNVNGSIQGGLETAVREALSKATTEFTLKLNAVNKT